MGTWDHMDGDYFADSASGCRPRFHSCFDGGYFPTYKNSDVARSDFFPTDQLDIGGLQHGVSRFELRREALHFNHSECLSRHSGSSFYLCVCRILTRFDGRLNAANIALHDGRDQPAADGNGFD